ncbi:MAG: hypothetical protein A2992_07810 [Elusimicrobia bacterium RIFCSPLOWO2_01_FULL_59_12]|nr:MAG: hypothetical protein A2992_07810 [Elusimicrobia bacterium RIFCSPLOWO2_01_FULL_59_12]
MKTFSFQALVAKEFREAVRSRWLLGLIAVFCFLAFGLSWIGTAASTIRGYSGFGRTSAALVNLVLLIVPLMGLTMGAFSLAGERERRTLDLLLVLPLRPAHIFWAKALGLGAALTAALSAAFGLSGLTLAFRGGLRDGGLYLAFFSATLLLAFCTMSLGLWISALNRRIAPAIGIALVAWFGFVLGGDLGFLGMSAAVRLSPEALLATAWLNPLSLYRLLAVDVLGAHLDMLGPAGLCAQDLLGPRFRACVLAGLGGWFFAALSLAYLSYHRHPLREG